MLSGIGGPRGTDCFTQITKSDADHLWTHPQTHPKTHISGDAWESHSPVKLTCIITYYHLEVFWMAPVWFCPVSMFFSTWFCDFFPPLTRENPPSTCEAIEWGDVPHQTQSRVSRVWRRTAWVSCHHCGQNRLRHVCWAQETGEWHGADPNPLRWPAKPR